MAGEVYRDRNLTLLPSCTCLRLDAGGFFFGQVSTSVPRAI